MHSLDTTTMKFEDLLEFFKYRERHLEYNGLAGWKSGATKTIPMELVQDLNDLKDPRL